MSIYLYHIINLFKMASYFLFLIPLAVAIYKAASTSGAAALGNKIVDKILLIQMLKVKV